MYKVEYSVLSYYPDIYLKSNLAVGVAFQIKGDGFSLNEMKFITKKNKLISFDDEIEDLEFIFLFLEGIKNEFINTSQSLSSYIRKFVNNFYFEDIEEKSFQNLKEAKDFVKATYKYILHLGLEKKERLKEKEKKDYIINHLKENYDNVHAIRTIKGSNSLDKFNPDFVVEKPDQTKVYYKFLNKNNTTVHNARSYLVFSAMNEEKIVLILENDMQKEKEYLLKAARRLDAQVEFITEIDLIK